MSTCNSDLNHHYEAVPFTLDHYPHMQVLFKSAFGIDVRQVDFNKRFNTAPLGCDVVGYIAIHKETQSPAAYYGVFPLRVTLKNQVILAAQSGDTMTHEKHRKKGLFLWLAKKTFQTCQEKGITFIFGLPNKNSFPGFVNHLNWLHTDNIYSYDLKLTIKTIPLPKIFTKLGVFSWYVRVAKAYLRKNTLDGIQAFDTPYKTAEGKILRDRHYLSYKAAPVKYFVRVGSVTAWIQLTDVLWVGDFDTYDLVDDITLKKLKRLAARLGYNTIRFNFNESREPPAFLKAFKKAEKEPLCFFYLDQKWQGSHLVLTAADFDTW